MVMPIVVYRPKFHLVPLVDGEPSEGELVDVSCDMVSVELGLDTPMITVKTFCGTLTVPDDIEESASVEVAVNAETSSLWAPLVGTQVEARIYDRNDSVDYRRFDTQIPADPSLYGATEPGEARTVEMDLPILSSPEWVLASS